MPRVVAEIALSDGQSFTVEVANLTTRSVFIKTDRQLHFADSVRVTLLGSTVDAEVAYATLLETTPGAVLVFHSTPRIDETHADQLAELDVVGRPAEDVATLTIEPFDPDLAPAFELPLDALVPLEPDLEEASAPHVSAGASRSAVLEPPPVDVTLGSPPIDELPLAPPPPDGLDGLELDMLEPEDLPIELSSEASDDTAPEPPPRPRERGTSDKPKPRSLADLIAAADAASAPGLTGEATPIPELAFIPVPPLTGSATPLPRVPYPPIPPLTGEPTPSPELEPAQHVAPQALRGMTPPPMFERPGLPPMIDRSVGLPPLSRQPGHPVQAAQPAPWQPAQSANPAPSAQLPHPAPSAQLPQPARTPSSSLQPIPRAPYASPPPPPPARTSSVPAPPPPRAATTGSAPALRASLTPAPELTPRAGTASAPARTPTAPEMVSPLRAGTASSPALRGGVTPAPELTGAPTPLPHLEVAPPPPRTGTGATRLPQLDPPSRTPTAARPVPPLAPPPPAPRAPTSSVLPQPRDVPGAHAPAFVVPPPPPRPASTVARTPTSSTPPRPAAGSGPQPPASGTGSLPPPPPATAGTGSLPPPLTDFPSLEGDGVTLRFASLDQYRTQHKANVQHGGVIARSTPLPIGTQRFLGIEIPGQSRYTVSARVTFLGEGTVGFVIDSFPIHRAQLRAFADAQ